MDLQGSEISRVGSRREISRVCLQYGKISRICQRTKNFAPARCARITHTHPSPRDAREAHTSLERSHVHLNRAGAQLRKSAAKYVPSELHASVIGVALWGERSEPHGNFCTRILHVWAGIRAFDSARKFRMLTWFRAFAPLAAKFRLLLTHALPPGTREDTWSEPIC